MTNPDQPAKFTLGSAQKIAEATRLVLNQPIDLRGRRRAPPAVDSLPPGGLDYQVLMKVGGVAIWDYPRMH